MKADWKHAGAFSGKVVPGFPQENATKHDPAFSGKVAPGFPQDNATKHDPAFSGKVVPGFPQDNATKQYDALEVLRVDGGMAASDWTMQRLADLTGSIVDRPQTKETTALGAAYLAGLWTGFFPEPDRFESLRQSERRFTPQMDAPTRDRKLESWASAVRRLLA
jgi:hypothetical protein